MKTYLLLMLLIAATTFASERSQPSFEADMQTE